jgi:hypothetical protein
MEGNIKHHRSDLRTYLDFIRARDSDRKARLYNELKLT